MVSWTSKTPCSCFVSKYLLLNPWYCVWYTNASLFTLNHQNPFLDPGGALQTNHLSNLSPPSRRKNKLFFWKCQLLTVNSNWNFLKVLIHTCPFWLLRQQDLKRGQDPCASSGLHHPRTHPCFLRLCRSLQQGGGLFIVHHLDLCVVVIEARRRWEQFWL